MKTSPDAPQLIDLPVERAGELIAGRFLITKRILVVPGTMLRWVRSLCLDLKEKGKYSGVYSIVVDTSLRKFGQEPPYEPTTEFQKREEFICDEINKEPLKYGP